MTDQRDPYADRPYVPPTSPQNPTDDGGGWPFAEPRAHVGPADPHTYTYDAGATDHEPTVAVNEPTVAFGGGSGSGGPVPPAFTPAPAPRKKRRAGRLVAAVTGIVLLSGASAAGGAAIYDAMNDDASVNAPSTGTSLDRPASSTRATNDISAVAEAILPATVVVNVAGAGASGTGTGIVISEDGNILTNNHVIEAAADGGTCLLYTSDAADE